MFDDCILVGFADVSGVAHCDKVWWLLQVHDLPVAIGLLFERFVVNDNDGCFFGQLSILNKLVSRVQSYACL